VSLSGLLAALTAVPIIMAVDKAVVQSTADSKISIMSSFKSTCGSFFKSPISVIKSPEFRWIWFVYGTTYIAGNTIDSLCKIYGINDLYPKLLGVTALNMTASVLKDRAFAKMFGAAGQTSAQVGAISLAIWLVRDILTVANAFVLPDRMSHSLVTSGIVDSDPVAKTVTQFACPVLAQFALTPLHLFGYDVYNRPGLSFNDRIKYLSPKYFPSVGIRMVRMGAAYGIGGVNNRHFRDYFVSMVEGPNWDNNYKPKQA
jgi:hypothetical protein